MIQDTDSKKCALKRTQNDHGNFQLRFSNIRKCKIKRGSVGLPKMKVSIPNTANTANTHV